MTLRLNGSTSGYVEVDSQAVGGNNTIQLPSSNGSANQFLKNGSTAGTLGWSSLVEDSNGRLLVGTSTSIGVGSADASLVQVAATNARQAWTSTEVGNQGARLYLGKSRGGSYGSYAVVANNDEVGTIYFAADDGTDLQSLSASIGCAIDGTPGSNDVPGRLVFSTTADGASSPTERMRITNGGYAKVSNTGSYNNASGTYHEIRSGTGGSDALNVTNSSASDPYGLGVYFTAASPNNATNYFIGCFDSSATRAIIRSNGGLANFQANNVNLSDRNAKKDISPAADTWDCIKEWEIVNYRYKDQPDDADLNLGVIAQQVAESCPEVITVFQEATEDEPEKLGIKEQQMYWMAIKALQEAQVRIETLEASNADLAERLTALEANS